MRSSGAALACWGSAARSSWWYSVSKPPSRPCATSSSREMVSGFMKASLISVISVNTETCSEKILTFARRRSPGCPCPIAPDQVLDPGPELHHFHQGIGRKLEHFVAPARECLHELQRLAYALLRAWVFAGERGVGDAFAEHLHGRVELALPALAR